MGLRERLSRALLGGAQRSAVDPNLVMAMSRSGSSYGSGSVYVDEHTALLQSSVWACINLRANLVSSMPVDVYRRVDGRQVEVPKPPLLTSPSPDMTGVEWFYATQSDLDRFGNAFGVIAERDALGYPKRVDLVAAGSVTASIKGGRVVEYKIGGSKYAADDVWHERQYLVGGSPMGLCPITHARLTIGGYLSAQKSGNDYYAAGGAPTGVLQNTVDDEISAIADEAKERFKSASANRDIFVVGKDWKWEPSAVPESAQAFLEERKFAAADVCRFFGVPAEMIGAGVSGSAITYANVTQQNLQFLITEIGPLIARREAYLNKALPAPRYVKFNTDALLRMDPETRARVLLARVAGRTLAPSEAREIDNLAPFTQEQIDEIQTLLPANKTIATRPETQA